MKNFYLGIALVAVLMVIWDHTRPASPIAAAGQERDDKGQAAASAAEMAKLRTEIQRLKDASPDQAHAMISMVYHFNNLWFAARAENWPLADFYWGETRSHLRWAVRIIPVRKNSAKQDVDLRSILQAVENTPLKALKEAIQAKDRSKFAAAYKVMLEGCYSCHKASEKPYLRPQIPVRPAEPTINFDPKAVEPK